MENENPVEDQVKKAVDKAYDEHIETNPYSKDVGRVADPVYAKHLANIEDGIRDTDPESKEVERYANNIIGEEIIKNMEEVAARKVTFNEGERYPDAQKDLIKKGINPVDRFDSRKKFGQIYDMQEAEKKRREYMGKKNN
ncbi:MAG TPA: hypothetical protein PKH06_00065 [Candidatus Dojkabacteria bacterium]|nr:hypothetical protein [Candidatus Dojkabacteria bacterium]